MELQTAKAWGKTPSEWDALDKRDRMEMISLRVTEQAMSAWEDYYQGQQMEKARLKSKRGLK